MGFFKFSNPQRLPAVHSEQSLKKKRFWCLYKALAQTDPHTNIPLGEQQGAFVLMHRTGGWGIEKMELWE